MEQAWFGAIIMEQAAVTARESNAGLSVTARELLTEGRTVTVAVAQRLYHCQQPARALAALDSGPTVATRAAQ